MSADATPITADPSNQIFLGGNRRGIGDHRRLQP
jgi:hypothetical protein